MIREKRRRKRLLKRFLIGLSIFAILVAIAVFIVIKVFVVKNVKVEGNELYEKELITETVLNDKHSWNSLYVFLKYTFVDTKELPFIDTMEIQLEDPQTLKIKVYEKGILGYLYISAIGENAYFDKDGFVVETSTRIIENVPKIEGLSCDEVVLYEKLPIDNKKLRDLLTLTQTLKREEFDSQQAQVLMRENLTPDVIHFGLEQAPVLIYGDTQVLLGSVELLTQKVDRLKEIFPSINIVAGTLHMEDWTEESANIIFEKEKQDDEAQVPNEENQPQDDVEEGEN